MKDIKSTFTATFLAAIVGLGALTTIATPRALAQGPSLLGVDSQDVLYYVIQHPTTGQLYVHPTVPQGYLMIYGPASRGECVAFYRVKLAR